MVYERSFSPPRAAPAPAVAPGTIVFGETFDDHRVTGYSNIGGHRIDCPLISHVEGNLYQGGCPDPQSSEEIDREGNMYTSVVALPDQFKHVVSLYPWGRYTLPEGCTRDEFKLYDSTGQDTGTVEEIAALAYKYVQDGPTLVHCQAGLNRSGLIAGRVLMLMGYTAEEAITKLRKRSPAVLCNPTFEQYLRGIEVDAELAPLGDLGNAA